MRTKPTLTIILLSACLATGMANAVSVATINMNLVSLTSSTAEIDVLMDLTGDAGDFIDQYQLSVFDSDLTSGNTDFGRFQYTPELDVQSDLDPDNDLSVFAGDVNSDGFTFLTTTLGDPDADPFTPNPVDYVLGRLSVNLAGVPGGTSVTVTLAGGVFPFDTDAAGRIDAANEMSWRTINALQFGEPGGLTFTVPQSQPGRAIPEPATAALLALAGCLLRRRR